MPATVSGFRTLMRPSRPLRERLLAAGVLAAVIAWYFLTWDSVGAFVRSIDNCPVLFGDFHAHYRPMGSEVLATGLPRPNFYYSPFFALLLMPFAGVSEAVAVALWSTLQGLAVALLVWAPLALAAARAWLAAAWLGVVLTSFPVLHNFAWGQVSVPLVALTALALLLRERGRPLAAGAVLASAVAIKFYVAIVLPYFVLRRDGRLLASFAVFALAFLLLVPGLLIGFERTIDFYRDVAHRLGSVQGAIAANVNSLYLPHVLGRLGLPALVFAGPLVALVNAVVVFVVCRRNRPHAALLSFTALHATVPFLVPTSWPHYFAFLPVGQLSLALVARGVVPRALLALSLVAGSIFWFRTFDAPPSYNGPGWLLWADVALLVALWVHVGGERPIGQARPATAPIA